MQPYVLNSKILSNSWSRLKPRPEIAENFSIPDIRLNRIIIFIGDITKDLKHKYESSKTLVFQ